MLLYCCIIYFFLLFISLENVCFVFSDRDAMRDDREI
jgi:hypothetical protein